MNSIFVIDCVVLLTCTSFLGSAVRSEVLGGSELVESQNLSFKTVEVQRHQTYEKDGVKFKVANFARPGPYKQMVAASAPVTTNCGMFRENGAAAAYIKLSHFCGIEGSSRQALDDHIDVVWKLIDTAYGVLNAKLEERGELDESTLRVFVAPEWAFRRYPDRSASDTWVPPLSSDEVKSIIKALEERMADERYDFSDWLVVPGTIQWGIDISSLTSDGISHGVFNSAPVFYGGRHIYLHNKFTPVSNYLDSGHEIWGYRLLEQFKDAEEKRRCTVCDSVREKARTFLTGKLGQDVADDMIDLGATVPADTVVINGLAVGVDICADLRAGIGNGIRAAERLLNLQHISRFDIQLLISSGMRFDVPEQERTNSVMVRDGGYALSADGSAGYQGGSQLYSLDPHRIFGTYWGRTGASHNLQTLKMANDFTLHSQDETLGADFAKRKQALGCTSSNKNTQPGCQAMWDCKYGGGMTPDENFYPSSRSIDGQAARAACSKQTGNWDLLKIWSTPLPLEAPRDEVLALGVDESGVIDSDKPRGSTVIDSDARMLEALKEKLAE